MVQKEVRFQAKHTYQLSQTPTGKEQSLWVVFHGYGQLAQFFLRKFKPLFHDNCLIVAAEGLNHFYHKGFSGRVGANWMTKHEREIDIANSNNYLNGIMEELLPGFDQVPEVNVLGFSQGAATMSRWICQSSLKPQKVVFWAGTPAHDMDDAVMVNSFKDSRVILALGDDDPFLASENYTQQENRLMEAGFNNFKVHNYVGGHELDPGLLKEIFLM